MEEQFTCRTVKLDFSITSTSPAQDWWHYSACGSCTPQREPGEGDAAGTGEERDGGG